MKIDDLDLKLLGLLSRNGRISSAEMARTIGVSERTVSNHVSRLIDEGVISIVGFIDRGFFGYNVVADIYCLVEDADMEDIAREIAKFDEVSYVAISFGDRDISVQVFAKSPQDVKEFVQKKLAPLPGIARTTTVILPTVIKEIYEWKPIEIEMAAGQEPRNP